MARAATRVKVADQVWIATALLHREHPQREGFAAKEIINRVRGEFGEARPGIAVHVSRHAVASLPPNPGQYRMLSSAGPRRWRLFRAGDPYHPEREGAKTHPMPAEIPPEYRDLLDWYGRYTEESSTFTEIHPLFSIAGIGDSGRSDISEEHDRYLADIYAPDSSDDDPSE